MIVRGSPAALVAAGEVTQSRMACPPRHACMVCGSTERSLDAVRQEFPGQPWWLCRDKDACRADAGDLAGPL